jgi:uncharacterized membrane protein
MAESGEMVGYAGVYANVEDARADFAGIKEAHHQKWIGAYDAALFEKTPEGKVKVLDTDATQRVTGAEVGAVTGAILGLIFPPSILVSTAVVAGLGAAAGNMAKGFTSGDIKHVAEGLEPGEGGVILVADATFEEGAEKLMKRAKKMAKQKVAAQATDARESIGQE